MNRRGFTLIEVMISMAIFSFIALGTAGAIQRGITARKIVQNRWDEAHGIRTALRIFNRDVYLAFHKQKKAGEDPFGFRSGKERSFRTSFLGESERVDFTSLSHRKIYGDVHESELCEVGYFLEPNEKNDGFRLMRRKSVIVEGKIDEGGETQTLLENVVSLEFGYYSIKDERMFDVWDIESIDFKDTFPDAVQMKIVVKTKRRL